MDRQAIGQHIDTHLQDHVEHIRRWVAQPSVSWDDFGVRECAELVAGSFRELGCAEVEVIEGKWHPGVWAYYDAGSPITIHSYCMFDTRTARPREWSHDPWSAALVPMGAYPEVLVGLGAMVAKGPYVAFLNALSSIIAVEGTLPVNVMFLAEGEEIMGSPAYPAFVARYRDRLQRVDASYCATASQDAAGTVAVGLGLKGMIVVELTANGSSWGHGPRTAIHSSAAAVVDSPPFRLVQALATLTEPDGRGCAVAGLRDAWTARAVLSDDEQRLLEGLRDRNAGRDWRDVLPVGGTQNIGPLDPGPDGMAPLREFLYGPTFNIAGMRSGFLGRGTTTIPFVVPASATATIDIRMVVDHSPQTVIDALRSHLDERGFGDVSLEVLAAFSHSQTPVGHPAVQAMLRTLQQWGVDTEVWPIQAGGGPWTVVPNEFRVPCLRGGVVGGGSAAAKDEYLVIEGDGRVAGLAEMERFHVDLLDEYARTALAARQD
jgi:acetylornithine deacetylase/succinyl-diaminopimelate desuccinylase-like protein